MGLIRLLAGFPSLLEGICKSLEPHRLTYYLTDLASLFHRYFNLGNRSADHRIVVSQGVTDLFGQPRGCQVAFPLVIRHGDEFWKPFVSMLRRYGYEGAISIEHEDPLMSVKEGFEKAVAYLRNVVIEETQAQPWWF